jgi:membrane protease YdiL (CAAX protease family)
MSVHAGPPTTPPNTPTRSEGARRPVRSRRRRILDAVTFVGVWVAAGYLLPLDSNGYLLLGIPLTVGFQVLVRRRPLRELFASGASRFSWGAKGLVLAAALAVVPGYYAARALTGGDAALIGWYLAAVVGALLAAFALRAGSVRGALRSAALPIAVGSGGMATVYGILHVVSGTPVSADAAMVIIGYTALYFPATFLLEEVTFRGALDSHVHHDGETRGWQSAVLVSALWGVWHLPVAHALPFPVQLAELVGVHIVLGVPLSFAWRRTRNLVGPALAHAVNDAVRNAFMLGL